MSEPQVTLRDWVLWNSHHFIAINKPAGLPVQDDLTKDTSLLALVSTYCKKPVKCIHRIDRPVSGLVIFAKSASDAHWFQEQQSKKQIRKTYLAWVENPPSEPSGTCTHYLTKQAKTNKVIAVDAPSDGAQEAIMHYMIVFQSDHYILLSIVTETGRHHQIRAQCAAMGCPIKGDVKYGARRKNADRSIHLHAYQMLLPGYSTKEPVRLIAPPDVPDASGATDPLWKLAMEYIKDHPLEGIHTIQD